MATENQWAPGRLMAKGKVKEPCYKVTDRRLFRGNGDMVRIEVSDTRSGFAWRMRVGRKKWSNWYSHYQGILVHDGYGLATAYWDGSFKEFVPFKITSTIEVKS